MQRILTVIVHHRGADMLGQCLDSLLDSRGHETEIVVVNNGCEEELPEVARSSSRVHEVRATEPLGFSEANNLGAGWAEEHLDPFDALYFVNNDTLSHPDALALQVAALEANPQAAIAGPRLVIWGAEDTLNSLGINVTKDAWGWDEGIGVRLADYGPLPPQRSVLAVTGSALLMRADAYRHVGGWSELYDYYFEDIDLCLKARRAGFDVVNVPDAVVSHGISATMTEGSARKDHFFWRNRLLLGFAHWPLALWPTLLGRAIGKDILLAEPQLRGLPRRALLEALVRLPRAWSLRDDAPRLSTSQSWTELLHPVGSVPVISLPEVCYLPLEKRISGPAVDAVSGASSALSAAHEAVASGPASRLSDDAVDSAELEEWKTQSGNRILVLGWSPLPFEDAQMNYAPGVRAWQLARSLAEDGHRVLLATARMPGSYEGAELGSTETVRDGVRIVQMSWQTFEEPGVLEETLADFDPMALVGATPLPARRAVEIAGERPLWIDLFGDPMAEAQSKSGVAGGNHVKDYRDLLLTLLDRGDVFSAVSDRQKWAVVGQLGLEGRLNRETAGATLVHTIPCSAQSMDLATGGSVPPGVVAPGDFVVLWSGGYNTWCDVDTLFEGVETAMGSNPDLHFVSTGGIIEGHDEETYPKFVERVENSPHSERFHLLGRVTKVQADAWVRRAQIGIVTERALYERDLGSSQRIYGWLAAGLPFVCTQSSEIGASAERQGFAYTYELGDPRSLANAIAVAARDGAELARRAESCSDWVATHGSDHAITESLREWAANPRRSSDAGLHSGVLEEYRSLLLQHQELVEEREALVEESNALRGELAETFAHLRGTRREVTHLRPFETSYHNVRSELGKIHESRMWKLWMTSLEWRRKLGI